MNSLAIKLDVNTKNQDDLNDLLMKVGLKPQRRRFHCTVGFLESTFDNISDAETFVEDLKEGLVLEAPLPFGLGEVRILFHHVVGLTPDRATLEQLQRVNTSLQTHVNAISDGHYTLNSQTTGVDYHPHITLWRQRHPSRRLKEVQDMVANWGGAPLELVGYSYTVL